MNQLPITSLRVNHVVAVDPDIDKSGYAVYSRIEKRLTVVRTATFAELLDLFNNFAPGAALFVVEAGWLNKSIWHGEPPGAEKWAMRSRLANAAEIGRRVGENAGVGKIIAHYLIAHGHELRLEQPTSAKLDHAHFCRLTGWAKQTNPESRDAGRIAFKYQ